MLLPTKDIKLQTDLGALICEECDNIACTNNPNIPTHSCFLLTNMCERGEQTLKKQLWLIERRGYHVGLPENIEWALNSGDGVYRP